MLIDSNIKDGYNILKLRVEKYKSKTIQCITKLDALSPLKTLTRGYSVVENEERKVVKSIKDVSKDDRLNIILNDGKIKVIVD